MATQLIIIDPSVPHYDQLLAGISGEYDLLILDQSQDGIQQIAAYLQGKSGYEAIQVFSHGSPGTLYLGSTVVNNSNLAEYQAQLQQIGSALTDTGDILLYGCHVAEGEVGNRFVNSFADYTGADIAASRDLTGNPALGGDWDLEASAGEVDVNSFLSADYSGVLTDGLTVSTNTQSGWGRTSGEFSNAQAFAVLKADGSVVTWGVDYQGGNSSGVATQLNGTDNSKDVTRIFSNNSAFAALRADGSVVTWGDFSGNSSAVATQLNGTDDSKDVIQLFSTYGAFAALRADGSVVTWGYSDSSAVATQLNGADDSKDVTRIFSSQSAFAALRADGSVVTWGMSDHGGDSSVYQWNSSSYSYVKDYSVASQLDGTVDVTQIFSTLVAFAALRADGSVVTWGLSGGGGDSSAVATQLDGTDDSKDVIQVFSTGLAFAALRADGSVVTWGNSNGGNSSAVAAQLDGTDDSQDVIQVFSTVNAFAALRADGSVVTWGVDYQGGNSSGVATQLNGTDNSKDVTRIFSNNSAFAALRADGSVVTWGGVW